MRHIYWCLTLIALTIVACSIPSNVTIWSGLPTPLATPTLYNAFEPPGSSILQAELLSSIEELMPADEKCQLPCVWGLRPSETSASRVLEFVRGTLGQEPYLGSQDNGWLYYEAFIPSNMGSLDIIFRIKDDVLIRTELRLIEPALWWENNPFALSELLENLGQPTDVYMRINPSVPINYNLAVVYEGRVVIVEYGSMLDDITVDEPIPICAQDHVKSVIRVWLQSDNVDREVRDNLFSVVEDSSGSGGYRDIEQMANINIETFTETFAGVPNACVEALSLQQLRESGHR